MYPQNATFKSVFLHRYREEMH